MDDPSACPYLYTDRLSGELPFFAQARPRRIIHLLYINDRAKKTTEQIKIKSSKN